MIKKIFYIISGFTLIILGFLLVAKIASAEYNYDTDLYICEGGTTLSWYDEYENYIGSNSCGNPFRLIPLGVTENNILIECDENAGVCNNARQKDEESSGGFILEWKFLKGKLPDDYIQQIEFIGIVTILAFLGTFYIIKKIV